MPHMFRPTVLISAAAAAALVGSPAFASSATTVPTSLNARATKAVVAPRHKDTVHLTLRSHNAGVGGEADNFVVRMRRDNGTSKWSTWTSVTATPGATTGKYWVTVTMPAKIGHGKKEQYQVKFTGDATKHLGASRSQIITVTAR